MTSKGVEMHESKPLVGGDDENDYVNGPRSAEKKKSCFHCKLQCLGLVALVAVVAWYLPQQLQQKHTTPEDVGISLPGSLYPPGPGDGTGSFGETPAIKYRPFCVLHNDDAQRTTSTKRTARILQTSMGSPSQQWSPVACFDQPQQQGLLKDDEDVRNVNAFGAPDAILQTSLTTQAFPNRSAIIGFGAAFTEAASLNYQALSDKGKESLMELMFGRAGLGYALGRVHINSCDFSVKSYNFDNVNGDFELKHFDTNVTHDAQKDGMMDMIRRATSVFNQEWKSQDQLDGHFKMYASPWSPPGWMKNPTWEDSDDAEYATNMTYSTVPSCLREGTGEDSRYAKAWALYFSKFLTAYKEQGIPMWAVTVQNEPEFPAPWEACAYTPEVEAEFISYHLGPQLQQDHPDVKIFMFDHNKDHVVTWANKILNEKHPSSQYVQGTAYHWYAGGMDRLLDGAVGIPNLHRLQEEFDAMKVPNDHILLNSEACHCPYTGYAGGSKEIYWARAERYAHAILADLTAGAHGWVEWNLVLDSIGGPNHLNNLCDTTILAVPHRAINGSDIPPRMAWEKTNSTAKFGYNQGDSRTREELNSLGFPAKYLDDGLAVQPLYFYMGHISRYVRPGSRAVKGFVDAAKDGKRTFRPEGQVVAGGGMNDLARVGIELTAWPCEGSTRQQFKFNGSEDKKEKHIAVLGHDWLGNPTRSCIASIVNKNFYGITLTECDKTAGLFEMVQEDGGMVKFKRTNASSKKDTSDDICLVLSRLKNNGGALGPKGGSQVTYGSCSSPAALWKYSEETSEIMSLYLPEGEVCMTTGWPFLQMGAFETPNGESDHTIVLLNEANDQANYVLYDGDDPVVSGSIPPRSIQTVLLDSAEL